MESGIENYMGPECLWEACSHGWKDSKKEEALLKEESSTRAGFQFLLYLLPTQTEFKGIPGPNEHLIIHTSVRPAVGTSSGFCPRSF